MQKPGEPAGKSALKKLQCCVVQADFSSIAVNVVERSSLISQTTHQV